MSTEERDTAQRCDRCQMVKLGTRACWWQVDTGLEESVALTWRLCRGCRTEVSSHLQHMIREAVTW